MKAKMKRLLLIAVAFIATLGMAMASCSNDEPEKPDTPDQPGQEQPAEPDDND